MSVLLYESLLLTAFFYSPQLFISECMWLQQRWKWKETEDLNKQAAAALREAASKLNTKSTWMFVSDQEVCPLLHLLWSLGTQSGEHGLREVLCFACLCW